MSRKVGKNDRFVLEHFRKVQTYPKSLVVPPTHYTWMDSPTIIVCSFDSLKAQIWFPQKRESLIPVSIPEKLQF